MKRLLLTKQWSLATVSGNPPAVFLSQVQSTTTQSPQSLHPSWVTTTKCHLLWYFSLCQTAWRITEILIILLGVFLHKQDQAHAKMFRGVISMLLWSGVELPFGVLLMKAHTHRRAHPITCGSWKLVVAVDLRSVLWLTPFVFVGGLPQLPNLLSWPVTSGPPSSELQPAIRVKADNESLKHI